MSQLTVTVTDEELSALRCWHRDEEVSLRDLRPVLDKLAQVAYNHRTQDELNKERYRGVLWYTWPEDPEDLPPDADGPGVAADIEPAFSWPGGWFVTVMPLHQTREWQWKLWWANSLDGDEHLTESGTSRDKHMGQYDAYQAILKAEEEAEPF